MRQGRGEYEVSEKYEELRPRDILDREIYLVLADDIIIDTETHVHLQGGKPRLRQIEKSKSQIQTPWQFCAAMMMPEPHRDSKEWGEGPVLQDKRYGIVHIELGEVKKFGKNKVRFFVKEAQVSNHSLQMQNIDYVNRLSNVRLVWERVDAFPESISQHIRKHNELVCSGSAISRECVDTIHAMQKNVSALAIEMGIVPLPYGADVLPSLVEFVHCNHPGGVLLNPNQIDPEQVELRKREVKLWRLQAARGAKGVAFRKAVREAYRCTCLICGVRFPSLGDDSRAGVDAAHILPWSEYDLDEVYNGLCLCKNHHWAFDEGLYKITFANGEYTVSIPEEMNDRILEKLGYSHESLKQHVGVIPIQRFPSVQADWPKPQCIEALNEILYG